EDNLPARLPLLGHLRHQLPHLGKVRLLPAVGQNPGAKLYDDARDVFDNVGTHVKLGSKRGGGCRLTNPERKGGTVACSRDRLSASGTSPACAFACAW